LKIKFLLLIIISFIYTNNLDQKQLDKIEELTADIDLAKDFTLKSVKNDSLITLSDMKDKVVLINFWATWCGPCRMEIPDFNELYEKYNSKGLNILGLSISDTKKQLENFLKAYEINYPVLYGDQENIDKIINREKEIESFLVNSSILKPSELADLSKELSEIKSITDLVNKKEHLVREILDLSEIINDKNADSDIKDIAI